MKQQRSILQKIGILTGSGLLVAAAVLLLSWQWNIHTSEKKAQACLHTLRTLIAEPQGATPEARRDNTMPNFSLDGMDFVGILEMPCFGSALPVCADWQPSSGFPCRFSGSIYDCTMQIGGTSQKGQYDFYREISVGDTLYFTDMEGNRFTYAVADIRYEKHADQAALQRNEAAFTLFIKNIYAFEYIIIFCDIAG